MRPPYRRLSLLATALLVATALPSSTAVRWPDAGDRASAVVTLFAAGVTTAAIAAAEGCTVRRVQQIVAEAGMQPPALPLHPQFEAVVQYEMLRHGPNYGFNMLLGALLSHWPSWRWPRERVVAEMRRVDPVAYEARRQWATRRIQRGVYFAPHFFYSLHIDLACKIQEYHVYCAAAQDGCTRAIIGLTALSDKMPITVYEHFFEPIARVHGLPDQVVTDKGNEWRLLAFACFLAARLAQRLGGRLPHRFTSSQHNVSAAASLST